MTCAPRSASCSSVREREDLLHPVEDCEVLLPFEVADYVDSYSSIHHATNLGRILRPDSEPLMPNWRHIPVAYHGRAGSIVVSGTPVPRPIGMLAGDGDGGPRQGRADRSTSSSRSAP